MQNTAPGVRPGGGVARRQMLRLIPAIAVRTSDVDGMPVAEREFARSYELVDPQRGVRVAIR